MCKSANKTINCKCYEGNNGVLEQTLIDGVARGGLFEEDTVELKHKE